MRQTTGIRAAVQRIMTGRAWHRLVLLLACLYPVLPGWFDQRLPATHEGYRYLLLSNWFSEALAAGVWYPRWLPQMNGGFGYPEFVFYQPAYFFLNALISLLAEPLLLRQLLTVSLVALIGGLGLYRLVRWYVTPYFALLLVACFQVAPYIHTNLYLRGDLSEWMVAELAPWPLYFLVKLCRMEESSVRQQFSGWLGLTISTAILCYSHPVALIFLPLIIFCLGVVCLMRVAPGRRLAVGIELTSAVGMGLALSAPYWLTVVSLKPQVNVAAVLDGFIAWKNTVPLVQLLFGSFIEGKQFWEFLGAPFVLVALTGWWLGRGNALVFGAGLVYMVFLIAMIPFGQDVWRLYPFSLLQFPWRLAVFAPVLQAVCLLGFYEPLSSTWRVGKIWRISGCCLLFGWSLINHTGFKPAETPDAPLRFNQETLACLSNFAQTGRPGSYVSTIDAGEWMPLSAKGIATLPARGTVRPGCDQPRQALAGIAAKLGMPDLFSPAPVPRPLLEIDHSGWTVGERGSHTPFRLDYQLAGTVPATLIINQLYLPGWKIVVNDSAMPSAEMTRALLPDGRMGLHLPPGQWRIQAWYDGPPGWQTRNWLIVILCGLAAIYWSYRWYAAGHAHEQ